MLVMINNENVVLCSSDVERYIFGSRADRILIGFIGNGSCVPRNRTIGATLVLR